MLNIRGDGAILCRKVIGDELAAGAPAQLWRV